MCGRCLGDETTSDVFRAHGGGRDWVKRRKRGEDEVKRCLISRLVGLVDLFLLAIIFCRPSKVPIFFMFGCSPSCCCSPNCLSGFDIYVCYNSPTIPTTLLLIKFYFHCSRHENATHCVAFVSPLLKHTFAAGTGHRLCNNSCYFVGSSHAWRLLSSYRLAMGFFFASTKELNTMEIEVGSLLLWF